MVETPLGHKIKQLHSCNALELFEGVFELFVNRKVFLVKLTIQTQDNGVVERKYNHLL